MRTTFCSNCVFKRSNHFANRPTESEKPIVIPLKRTHGLFDRGSGGIWDFAEHPQFVVRRVRSVRIVTNAGRTGRCGRRFTAYFRLNQLVNGIHFPMKPLPVIKQLTP